MQVDSVTLTGLKGRSRQFRFGRFNFLRGPNGAGKSALLGGVQFALRGEYPGVPQTKLASLGADGSFTVALGVSDGARRYVVTRGIESVEEGGSRMTLDVLPGATAKTLKAAEAALAGTVGSGGYAFEMASFMAATPAKKAETLLRLCPHSSADEVDVASVLDAAAGEADLALDAESRAALIASWSQGAPINANFDALLSRVSALVSGYAARVREAEGVARRLAESAAARLPAAPVNAAESSERRQTAAAELHAAEKRLAGIEEVRAAFQRAEDELRRGGELVASLAATVEDCRRRITETEPVVADRRHDWELAKELADAVAKLPDADEEDLAVLRQAREDWQRTAAAATAAADALRVAGERADEQRAWAEVAHLATEIVDGFSVDSDVDARCRKIVAVAEKFRGLACDDARDSLAAAVAAQDAAEALLRRTEAAHDAKVRGRQQGRRESSAAVSRTEKALVGATGALRDAKENLARSERIHDDALASRDRAAKKLLDLAAPDEPGELVGLIARRKADLARLDQELRDAGAAGELATEKAEAEFRAADLRERAAGLRRLTGALTKRAALDVQKAVAPILARANDALRVAGSPFQIVVNLVAGFALGVVVDGVARPWLTLSAGESVFVTAALSVAMAEAGPGPLRLLLVEAAELDDANLDRLMDALPKMTETLQVFVATCHGEPVAATAPDWYSVPLGGDA